MRLTPLLVVLVSVVPVSARAQGNVPRVSLSAGVGITQPFHGDLDFIAPAWEVGARLGRGRAVVDVVFNQWRHADAEVFTNVNIQSPTGVLGRVDRIDQRTERVSNRGEVDLLARAGLGRLTVAGGGGVGVITMRRETRQTGTGCAASVTDWCQTTRSAFSNASLSVQGVGTVDVRLARWVWASSAVRLVVPTQDVGSTELQVTGGVRVGW